MSLMAIPWLVLLGAVGAWAVCVEGHPSVAQEYSRSQYVLTATVLSMHNIPAAKDGFFLDGDVYAIRPIRVFKGSVKGRVPVFSENSSGRFPMELGKNYLLFLYRTHGRWSVDNCGNSALVSASASNLGKVSAIRYKSGSPVRATN